MFIPTFTLHHLPVPLHQPLNFPLFYFIGIAPISSLNRFTTPPPSSADPHLPTFCINQLKCTSKFVLRPLPLPATASRRRPPASPTAPMAAATADLALGSPCAASLHPRRRDLYPLFAQRPFMAALHRRPQRSFAAGRGEIPERRGEKKELKRPAKSGAATVNFPQMFLLTTDPQV